MIWQTEDIHRANGIIAEPEGIDRRYRVYITIGAVGLSINGHPVASRECATVAEESAAVDELRVLAEQIHYAVERS